MTSIALFGEPATIDTPQDTLEQQAQTTGEAVQNLTPAQLEAGNFKQGHIKLFRVDFTIRTPRGHYGDYLKLFGAKSVACKISPYTHIAYPTTQSIRQGSLYGQSDPVPALFGLRRDMDTVFAVSVGLSDRPDMGKRWVLVIGADDATDARSIVNMVLQDCVRHPSAISVESDQGYWYLHESLELEPALLKSWLNDGLPNPEHLLKSESLLANLFAYQQGLPIDTAWQHDPERTARNARYLACAYDGIGQMTEALALDEAQDMTEGEGVSGVAMDALAAPYKRLEQVLNRLLLPAMRSVAGDLQISDNVQLTQPKRLAGVLQIAALFALSDGQTITIWFHNIDATPAKLSPDDPMTAWKWLLNKKNITVLVAPEGGKDLGIREIATRIMRMANKNSISFLKAQAKRTDLEQQLTSLDEQILQGQQVLSSLDAEIAELEGKEADQAQPDLDPQVDVTQAANTISSDVSTALPTDVEQTAIDPIAADDISTPDREFLQSVMDGVAMDGTPVDAKAHEAATSPHNDLPEPTDQQKKAGMYQMGEFSISGLTIKIENPEGSVRSGVTADGVAWETQLQHHYGYITSTKGADGDEVDVFVKVGTPDDFNGDVYVIDQIDPIDQEFDEHKVVIGADSEDEAKAVYLSNYDAGWTGLGAITTMSWDEFTAWVSSDSTHESVALDEANDDEPTLPSSAGIDSMEKAKAYWKQHFANKTLKFMVHTKDKTGQPIQVPITVYFDPANNHA
ncbi:MAG: hypothetical protein VXW65_04155, partial [Pseudomonadota bacterium]|nr:hypothetical protein [Pseudomonadota bacterium]